MEEFQISHFEEEERYPPKSNKSQICNIKLQKEYCQSTKKTTEGRWRIFKLIPVGYRPFFRCFLPFDLIDYFLFLIFVAFNLYIYYDKGGFRNLSNIKIQGKIVGIMAHWNMLALMLPITRNGIFSLIFGCSWERLIVFHKWVARWAVVLMIAHTILLGIFFYQKEALIHKFTEFEIIMGEIAGVAMILLTLTSLKWVRRGMFQVFMKFHYILFILALASLPFHEHGKQYVKIIIAGVLLYLFDWMIRAWGLMRNTARVERVQQLEGEYIVMDVKLMRPFSYTSGQWVNLSLPSLTRIPQLHPFSIASSPLLDNPFLLQFIIKAERNYTRRLLALSSPPSHSLNSTDDDCDDFSPSHQFVIDQSPSQTNNRIDSISKAGFSWLVGQPIWIDGPYGNLTIASPRHYPLHVIISGGVGATPALSLWKSIVYENAQCADPANKMNVMFVWSARNYSLFRFSQHLFLPLLQSGEDDDVTTRRADFLRSLPPSDDPSSYSLLFDELSSFPSFYSLSLHISSPSPNPSPPFPIDRFLLDGRPDIPLLLSNVKHSATLSRYSSVSVFVSGPNSLIQQTLRECSLRSSPFLRFDVHHERFDI